MAVSCGTVGGSSLDPNAPHSVPRIEDFLLELRELVTKLQWFREQLEQERAYSNWLHQYHKREMADLLDSSGFSQPLVPKNRMRPLSFPSKYREKPVERARPKCSPRRIIHQPR